MPKYSPLATTDCQEYLEKLLAVNDTQKIVKTCAKDELIYDRNVVKTTITEDFGMVCQDTYQRAIFSSLFCVGRLLGSMVIGYISDTLGRMKALTIGVLTVAVVGVIEPFVSIETSG